MNPKSNRISAIFLRRRLTKVRKNTNKSPWNSLEFAKILTALLVPLTIGGFGLWLNIQFKAVEEKRLHETVASETFLAWNEAALRLATIVEELNSASSTNKDLARLKKELQSASIDFGQKRLKHEIQLQRELFANDKDLIKIFYDRPFSAFARAYKCVFNSLESKNIKDARAYIDNCQWLPESGVEKYSVFDDFRVCISTLAYAVLLTSDTPGIDVEVLWDKSAAHFGSALEHSVRCPISLFSSAPISQKK